VFWQLSSILNFKSFFFSIFFICWTISSKSLSLRLGHWIVALVSSTLFKNQYTLPRKIRSSSQTATSGNKFLVPPLATIRISESASCHRRTLLLSSLLLVVFGFSHHARQLGPVQAFQNAAKINYL